MTRFLTAFLAAASLAFAGPVSTATAAAVARPSDGSEWQYLSLGDSLAAGFQPVDRTHNRGYTDQLWRQMRKVIPGLEQKKLGCPEESGATMIDGGICPYREGSQLAQALAFLQAHQGNVSFITINLGTNDVFGTDGVFCLDFESGLIDLDCVQGELPRVESNLSFILESLQAAAPGVPIVGMSYYDPFLGYWVFPGFGEDVARADEEAMEALNAGLVQTYLDEGALVADVAGDEFFDIANFTDQVLTEKFGLIPVNVANACHDTWFCAPCPLCPDVHATTEGYGMIAKAFMEALGR
jgi:lysophospholipase L1-like esterase